MHTQALRLEQQRLFPPTRVWVLLGLRWQVPFNEAAAADERAAACTICRGALQDLEKIKRKQIAYELHAQTLGEYVKCKRIPRGLRSHLRPSMFTNNAQFCQKWEAILNKCSLDLMVAIIEEIQKELPRVIHSSEEVETKLRNHASPAVVAEGKKKLTDHLQSFRTEVQTRKRNKFQRDAADYEDGVVYKWVPYRNEYPAANRRPQNPAKKAKETRRVRASTEASDSQDTSLSFLGGSQGSITPDREDTNVEGENTTRKKQQGASKRRRMRW
ncbi:hypothetical protein XELAEV_18032244mg [Xenopus laevis]|uniref:Uncharacterized protein n=1 Tax=Xenopus laevis TaxID=8355 RepID=A0A974HGU8_XENLA|nr:hypothetical protein XELAEV_18032244mg [Xenopus laevis]